LAIRILSGEYPAGQNPYCRRPDWQSSLNEDPELADAGRIASLTDLSGPEVKKLRSSFRSYIDSADETMHVSRVVVADSAFARLGLADTAIALASGTPMLVLTHDLTLWRTLTDRGIDAINFNHVRTFG